MSRKCTWHLLKQNFKSKKENSQGLYNKFTYNTRNVVNTLSLKKCWYKPDVLKLVEHLVITKNLVSFDCQLKSSVRKTISHLRKIYIAAVCQHFFIDKV